ncbi:MAG: hypothetical protein RL264_160 [Bacteroidota bacterium]|jgi:hypothetical protein
MHKTIIEEIPIGETAQITWRKEDFSFRWLIAWRKHETLIRKISFIRNKGQYDFLVNNPEFVLCIYSFSVLGWKKVVSYEPNVKMFTLQDTSCQPILPHQSVQIPNVTLAIQDLNRQPKFAKATFKKPQVKARNSNINLKINKLETKIVNIWKM